MDSIELSSPKRNFVIIGMAITEEVPKILQILLHIQIPPSELEREITRKNILKRLLKYHLQLVSPDNGDLPDYETFDITLLYTLLRNLCPDYTPTRGWGKEPNENECNIGDDIERLRLLRNSAFAHVALIEMTDSYFLERWGSLVQICRRMEDNIENKGHRLKYKSDLETIYKLVPKPIPPSFFSKLTRIHIFGSKCVQQGEDTEILLFYDCDDQTLVDIGSLFWKRKKERTTHTIDKSNYKYEGSKENKLVIRKTSKEDEGIYQVEVKMKKESIIFHSNEIQLKIIGGSIQPNWKKDTFLGQGAFGKVYVCEDGKTAVKITKIEGDSTFIQTRIADIQNEINVLNLLDHKRIVRYLACQHDSEEISIFMEYLPKGSLKREIVDSKGIEVSTARDYTKQILEGLEFLHQKKITHRDIKASNILRGEDGLKLADFGVSKLMEDISSGKLHSQVGTPHWQSPEIIGNKGHGRRTDIWSLGCTIVEMLTGHPPWHEYKPYQAIFRIGNGMKPEYILPEGIDEACKNVLSLCFKQNPNDRPYAWDLLKNEWLTLT